MKIRKTLCKLLNCQEFIEPEIIKKVEYRFVRSHGVDNPAYISKATRKALQTRSVQLINKVSEEKDIDNLLVRAIAEKESDLIPTAFRVEPQLREQTWYRRVMTESNRDPDEILNTASVGLMQILFVNTLPHVHEWDMAIHLIGQPGKTLRLGIDFFKKLMRNYGNPSDALQAYNAGEINQKVYKEYASPILKRWRELKSQ